MFVEEGSSFLLTEVEWASLFDTMRHVVSSYVCKFNIPKVLSSVFSSTTNPPPLVSVLPFISFLQFSCAGYMVMIVAMMMKVSIVTIIIIIPLGDPHLVHEFLILLANCVPKISFRCQSAAIAVSLRVNSTPIIINSNIRFSFVWRVTGSATGGIVEDRGLRLHNRTAAPGFCNKIHLVD